MGGTGLIGDIDASRDEILPCAVQCLGWEQVIHRGVFTISSKKCSRKGNQNDQNCLLWVLELVCFQGRTEGEQEGHQEAIILQLQLHQSQSIQLQTDHQSLQIVTNLTVCGIKSVTGKPLFSTSRNQKKEQGTTNVGKLTKNKKIMSGPAPFSMGCLPRVRRGSVKS